MTRADDVSTVRPLRGVQIRQRGRAVDHPNGPTVWAPQVSPSVTQPLKDFDRRPAAFPTRHGNQLGTVHLRIFLGSDKTTCPAGGSTEQVFNAHTYGGVSAMRQHRRARSLSRCSTCGASVLSCRTLAKIAGVPGQFAEICPSPD
jgi:hypothetical protein